MVTDHASLCGTRGLPRHGNFSAKTRDKLTYSACETLNTSFAPLTSTCSQLYRCRQLVEQSRPSAPPHLTGQGSEKLSYNMVSPGALQSRVPSLGCNQDSGFLVLVSGRTAKRTDTPPSTETTVTKCVFLHVQLSVPVSTVSIFTVIMGGGGLLSATVLGATN